MNRTVNLTKRVQTSRGLRYCPVVLAANGRLRADLVIINGQEERHPEGAYYLEWWEGVKRVRLSVGKDAADASARRLQKEAELNAVNHGVAVTQNGNANGHRSVAVAVTEFLDETKLTKKPKTHAAYSMRLRWPLGNWLLSLRPSKVKLHEGNGDRRWTTCPRIDITSSQIAGPRKTGAAEPTPWEKGARIRSSSPFASKLQSFRLRAAPQGRQGAARNTLNPSLRDWGLADAHCRPFLCPLALSRFCDQRARAASSWCSNSRKV